MSGSRRRLGPSAALLLGMALLSACASPDSPGEVPAPNVDGHYYVACEPPRPEGCVEPRDPVCGYHLGGWRGYSSACEACADPAVRGYRHGVCPASGAVE